MLTALSDALQIARSMDAQEMQHRDDKMDRNAFHRALVSALSDPYTISGRATAENLKKLAKKIGSKKDSFVLDARFELGKRDDAYLQAPVLPLQTADDDDQPLGMQLDPLFETAHRKGMYTALLEELQTKVKPDVDRMKSALRVVGWMLTMPEVYGFVDAVLASAGEEKAGARALISEFNAVGSDAEGEVKILKLTKAGVQNLDAARSVAEAAAAIFENVELEDGNLKRLFEVNDSTAVALATEFSLCAEHGIHQISDAEKAWLEKLVPDAEKALADKANQGRFPEDFRSIKTFRKTPTVRNLATAIEDIKGYPIEESVKAANEGNEPLYKTLERFMGTRPATEFAYTAPKAKHVKVHEKTCVRKSVQQSMAQFAAEYQEGADAITPIPGRTGEYAKWTALQADDTVPALFKASNDAVATAVARASCLELVILTAKKEIVDDGALGPRLVAAHAKMKQLAALKVCIENKDKFSGLGFNLPVLRCRAIQEGNAEELTYYKFKVEENALNPEALANTVEPKDFEAEVGLRDLSGICMPASVDVTVLKDALHDGIDAAENLKCNTDEQQRLAKQLADLDKKPGDSDDLPDAAKLVDDTARKRRRDVWSDGLREAALSNDKLYSFARQLGGSIGEPMSEIAVIDDSKLAAESKQLRDARQRASQRAADQHADLVKNVIAQVMKDSQLTLGVSDQGSSFAGTSTGGPVDLTKIKIVSGALRREASELAGLGKDGETDRFFGNAVKLESLLRSGTGEMSMAELLAQLRVAGQQLQLATAGEMELDGIAGNSASIEYLSSPRNSLMLRWRPEALAAIREAFAHFKQEMRYASHGMATHDIRAYELIEGRDGELTTLFATLCGLKMASSRLHSSSQSAYTSKWAARSNSQQLGIALQRVCRQAKVYGMNGGGMGRSRQQYHR